jgi:hypothetical protein
MGLFTGEGGCALEHASHAAQRQNAVTAGRRGGISFLAPRGSGRRGKSAKAQTDTSHSLVPTRLRLDQADGFIVRDGTTCCFRRIFPHSFGSSDTVTLCDCDSQPKLRRAHWPQATTPTSGYTCHMSQVCHCGPRRRLLRHQQYPVPVVLQCLESICMNAMFVFFGLRIMNPKRRY